MRADRLLTLLAAALAGCGREPAIEPVDAGVRVVLGSTTVAPGEPFDVRVVRTWRKDLEPEPWTDRALAPLALRSEGVSWREDGARREETRRFRAQALRLGDAAVSTLAFEARPREEGSPVRAFAGAFRVEVVPALPAEDPGPPELPPAPESPRFPWAWPLGGAFLLLLLARLAHRRRGRAPLAPPGPLPREDPLGPARAEALAGLSGLRARVPPQDPGGARAEAFEASELVRAFVEVRYGIPAPRRTSEELVRALGPARPAPFLRAWDLAKFAGRVPSVAERMRDLEAAQAFVREEGS
jgi:hypothetical protein